MGKYRKGIGMTARPLMFHELAEYYDRLVAGKDSRAEVQRLESLARRFGHSRGRDWLDVACGTGRHLEFLQDHYRVTGVDLSRPMLRVARRRLPRVRLHRGDMRTFRLGTTFDVVSCLFSAIGHLQNEREVQAAFTNFARHLKPGGVTIVEPWIDPSQFHPGHLHLVTHDSPEVKIARLSFASRRKSHSRIHYQYLIGEAGRDIRHWEETDVGLLVSRDRLVELMGRAGLDPRFLSAGLTPGRGLLVGVNGASPGDVP